MVRWDGLREALLLLATSPEVFLAHRDNYMRSLSATSAFGWLAGVGDRHPQNFLLEKRTGAIVPIDFGYSFGTAVMVRLRVFHMPLGWCDVITCTSACALRWLGAFWLCILPGDQAHPIFPPDYLSHTWS